MAYLNWIVKVAENFFTIVRADTDGVTIQPQGLKNGQKAKSFHLMEIGNYVMGKIKSFKRKKRLNPTRRNERIVPQN